MKKHFSLLIIIGFTMNIYGQEPTSQYKKLADEGLELLKQQNITAAIDKYKQALEAKQNGVEAHYGLGVCYSAICIQNGNYCNEAINHFLEVEKLAKGYRSTYRNICTCFLKTFQYQKAIDYANKAITQDGKDGESYFYRGFAKIELAKTKEACADLQQALKLGFKEADNLLNKHCK
jgi:tetratricopeptide (TPR) repeat protein